MVEPAHHVIARKKLAVGWKWALKDKGCECEPAVGQRNSSEAESYNSDCDSFCVVRNPLDRFLSHWRWRHVQDKAEKCSAEFLENYTKEKLTRAHAQDVLLEDCHFVPQVLYTYKKGDSSGPRICKHILKLEELREGFDLLMASYNLTKVKLGTRKTRRSPACNITPTAATLQMIEDRGASGICEVLTARILCRGLQGLRLLSFPVLGCQASCHSAACVCRLRGSQKTSPIARLMSCIA
eukprot:s4835_g12.t1